MATKVEVEVVESDSRKMASLFDMAINDLELMFKGRLDPTGRDKVATTVLSTFSRLKATEVHADALRYQVVKDLSKDKEELRKYVEATMPQLRRAVSK